MLKKSYERLFLRGEGGRSVDRYLGNAHVFFHIPYIIIFLYNKKYYVSLLFYFLLPVGSPGARETFFVNYLLFFF